MTNESRGRHHPTAEDTSLDLYYVDVPEIFSTVVQVRAKSKAEAEELVRNGKGFWGSPIWEKRLVNKIRAIHLLPAEKCCNRQAVTREEEEALCSVS